MLAETQAQQVNQHLTIYPIVSLKANQGWKCELFELTEPIQAHYHKIQQQIVLVVDGELKAFLNNEETVLQKGEFLCVDPGVVHAFVPEGKVRFIVIDLPGFQFPEDVFKGNPPSAISKWSPPATDILPVLDPKFFKAPFINSNYSAYLLVDGKQTGMQWGAALLEIQDSPKHFHKIEKEFFVVVAGKLMIENDNSQQILMPGEFIMIHPQSIHRLKSATNEPVRVLCFSFPSFDPQDMYIVD